MSAQFQMDFSKADPPSAWPSTAQALWWLGKGNMQPGPEWANAHDICQSAEGEHMHDWIHALCHLIEGDHGNAAYWFRRAGKPSATSDPETLWQEIAGAL